ncbi:hypothetical protein GCM10011608_02510 [Micromonospora sonchi]|uniref:Uncharacterized protein n=1 Tax=Micromonospora sonchi TaxID=1763543 RepID=A0A917TF74_9ACTN|nr:hypothetical protein [Micromonospora sonchi]GGM21340.1 hypothetical protein GCM10011608_02510 [Micromonospora sonchi]
MGKLRPPLSDETAMRADASKQERFDRLLQSPYFDAVVAANRAYLDVAIPDAARTEREHWALSCLPGTTPGRLSAISAKTMETFVLHENPDDDAHGPASAFVIVRRSVLGQHWSTAEALDEAFPGLDLEESDYRDATPDQVRIWGWHDEMIRAFEDDRFAAAVRDLVDPLLDSKTMHWRGHNYQLADHVLDRAPLVSQ